MSAKYASTVFRILLIEDNAADVHLLRMAFREAHVEGEFIVLEDGAAAMSFIRCEGEYSGRWAPDLAVLDLNLPKIGGMEVLEAFRGCEELANVPVAVVTSSAAPRERAKATELRADRFITKPPNLEKFLEIGLVLRAILHERQSRQTAGMRAR